MDRVLIHGISKCRGRTNTSNSSHTGGSFPVAKEGHESTEDSDTWKREEMFP